MKNKLIVGLAAAVAVTASTALAAQIQIGYLGSDYGPYQTGQGGEFTFNPLNPSGWLSVAHYSSYTKNIGVSGTFQTFCIEGGETINGFAATYNAALNQNAVFGGVGASGDPVSVGTGWLYRQFASGNWEGSLSYDYTNPGRSGAGNSADLLQQAIWWLEGENSVAYNGANVYMAGAVAKFGSQVAAKADGGWNYGVYAINLWTGTDPLQNRAQDGLYWDGKVPDGGMTIFLLGMGLAGMGFVARRRS